MVNKKEDMQILIQLYCGNHLEPKEMERASSLLAMLQRELLGRLK